MTLLALVFLLAQTLEPRVDRLECRDSGGMWEEGECLCATGKEFVVGEGCVVVEEPPPVEPPPTPPEPPPEPPPTGSLDQATWTQIPNSAMRPVFVAGVDDAFPGNEGAFDKIQVAWSGATCIGDELFLWGGGHGNGPHNGVLAVDVHTGTWRRVTEPSPIWTEETCPNGICTPSIGEPCELGRCGVGPDGRPVARHTYYQLTSDGEDLYAFGGSIWGAGTAGEAPHFWRLDLPEAQWVPLPERAPARPYGTIFAAEGRVYQTSPRRQAGVYDLAAGTWASGSFRLSHSSAAGIVYAPSVRRAYALGDGYAWSVGLDDWGTDAQVELVAEGAALDRGPGLTYYPPSDLVLAWSGGPSITTLDPHTGEWGTATPAGDPGPALENGTFGRFAYCGGRVVLVNGVDVDLWYLAAEGAPPPDPEPEPEPDPDPEPIPEPEPPPPPPQPPPEGLLTSPYYAEPPSDALVLRDCGPESEWAVVDVRTDEDVAAIVTPAGSRTLIRVHTRPEPYPVLKVKGGLCVKVLGVGDPSPIVAAVNATKSYKGEIRPGGLIIENVEIRASGTVGDCIGIPNDQQFVIVRDSIVGPCGHHSFVAMHQHSMYVEIGRSHFQEGGTHNTYINHIGMAWIYDSTFESPGWGHALRCVALRCRIERVKVSNVELDGSVTIRDNGKERIGMTPLEIYTCGEHEIRDVHATIYASKHHNINVAAILRPREGFQTCDVGEVVDGEWTPLEWDSAEFFDPARWATVTPFRTTVERMTIECIGPDVALCAGWEIKTNYPYAEDPQKKELRVWLQGAAITEWSVLLEAIDAPENPWWWSWVAAQTLPRHQDSFLKGSLTNKVPLPVPVPGWFQRDEISFSELTVSNGALFREESGPVTYCHGVPPVDGECIEQLDGRSFYRALVEVKE